MRTFSALEFAVAAHIPAPKARMYLSDLHDLGLAVRVGTRWQLTSRGAHILRVLREVPLDEDARSVAGGGAA